MTETDKSRLIDLDEVVATKFKGKKIPGFVMRFLKSYVHQDFLNSIIKKNGDGIDFCTGLIQELNITLDVKGLENGKSIMNLKNHVFFLLILLNLMALLFIQEI